MIIFNLIVISISYSHALPPSSNMCPTLTWHGTNVTESELKKLVNYESYFIYGVVLYYFCLLKIETIFFLIRPLIIETFYLGCEFHNPLTLLPILFLSIFLRYFTILFSYSTNCTFKFASFQKFLFFKDGGSTL